MFRDFGEIAGGETTGRQIQTDFYKLLTVNKTASHKEILMIKVFRTEAIPHRTYFYIYTGHSFRIFKTDLFLDNIFNGDQWHHGSGINGYGSGRPFFQNLGTSF